MEVIFRKLLDHEILAFSDDGASVQIQLPKQPPQWIPIVQAVYGYINFSDPKVRSVYEFYILGNNMEGYVQLPVKKLRVVGTNVQS